MTQLTELFRFIHFSKSAMIVKKYKNVRTVDSFPVANMPTANCQLVKYKGFIKFKGKKSIRGGGL